MSPCLPLVSLRSFNSSSLYFLVYPYPPHHQPSSFFCCLKGCQNIKKPSPSEGSCGVFKCWFLSSHFVGDLSPSGKQHRYRQNHFVEKNVLRKVVFKIPSAINMLNVWRKSHSNNTDSCILIPDFLLLHFEVVNLFLCHMLCFGNLFYYCHY